MTTARLRALARSAADAADLLQDCCPALRTPPLQAGAVLAATAALLDEITGNGSGGQDGGGAAEGGDTGAREPDDPGLTRAAMALEARIEGLRRRAMPEENEELTGVHSEEATDDE